MHENTGKMRRFEEGELEELPSKEQNKWKPVTEEMATTDKLAHWTRNHRRLYAKFLAQGMTPDAAFCATESSYNYKE